MSSDNGFHQELEHIQNIIDRQASNSFKIKGWTVTLVVVALLFRTNNFQLFAAFIPLIGFWYLDAYYLRQERKFRKLFDWVRLNRDDTDEHLFNMDPSRFEDEVDGTTQLMTTRSMFTFYGTIAGLLIIYTVILICINGGEIFG
ncbi:hypothetical protein NDI76_22355 [Halogeometricum sp. S1BR25-6]|uniref:Uncharacterized protein n=1 Tax=Halogeometricum salsisoli TaxID=2950536 RepID=A0ABU2GKX1_9EURY|nr:hypothetical protein [Halogeometricum sp. S1BR25-6]MDS0301473.1 hypothetical protein [Halogeometricum sp. S1BR25-6]